MAQLTMTKAEREAFLAGLHVAVLSIARSSDAPLAAPVWYEYEPGGDVLIVTGRDAEKTRLAREHGQASLCAQTETMPYQFVTVAGLVTVDEGKADRDLRARMARRYLGPELGDLYVEATEEEDAVTMRITPQRWWTTDYSKL